MLKIKAISLVLEILRDLEPNTASYLLLLRSILKCYESKYLRWELSAWKTLRNAFPWRRKNSFASYISEYLMFAYDYRKRSKNILKHKRDVDVIQCSKKWNFLSESSWKWIFIIRVFTTTCPILTRVV